MDYFDHKDWEGMEAGTYKLLSHIWIDQDSEEKDKKQSQAIIFRPSAIHSLHEGPNL